MVSQRQRRSKGQGSGDVSDIVYLLWFVQEHEKGQQTELLIGVYDSEASANAAIERLKKKPGFVDFPEGFQSIVANSGLTVGQEDLFKAD